MVHAGEIYLAKTVQFGKSVYRRPCLVLRTDKAGAIVGYFSTKLDLMVHGDLLLEKLDQDFSATGLSDTSYLVAGRETPVEMSFFNGAKYLGCVVGALKAKVEFWWGAPLVDF